MTRRPVDSRALLAFYAPLDTPENRAAPNESTESGPAVPEAPETERQDAPGATNATPRGVQDGRP